MKPGYLTTEFYVSLLTYIVAIIGLFGVHIANADASIQAIASVLSLVITAITSIYYTHSRTSLKANLISNMSMLAVSPTPTPRPVV